MSPLHGVARAAQLDRALDLRGAGDGGDLARSRSRPPYRGGKNPLFDGFSQSLELEHLGVRQSPFATFIDYRVKK